MNKFRKIIQEYNHWQRLIICICISIVCVGSQKIQTSAWNSGSVEFFRDLTGILMSLIIMTNFHRSEIIEHKKIYISWTVLSLIGSCIWIPYGFKSRLDFLKSDTIILAVAFWLMGYCVIYSLLALIKEKKSCLSHFYKPLMIIWVIMFVLMMLSRSTYLWPFAYFSIFLTFYFTKQTEQQRSESIIGISNGLILGFMLVQGHSMLTRPFDLPLYYGNFSNPNHNSMFLCMCLAGILGRIIIATYNHEKMLFRITLFILLGVDLSYIYMTGSKSGHLTTFLEILFFIVFYCRIVKKHVFIKVAICIICLFVISMPVTYLAVRYLPTIHPHINFYANDYYSLDRVHYYDPYDSPKYTSFESVVKAPVYKIKWFVKSIGDHLIPNQHSKSKDPVLSPSEASDTVLVRYTIYKWYFDHLTLRGSTYDEQGFQLTEDHWIQDTHNIYLDYGINFGWPVMILFAIMIWWGIIRTLRIGIKLSDAFAITSFFVLLAPPVFGLFEYSWGPGMISTIAFYVCMKQFLVKQIQ